MHLKSKLVCTIPVLLACLNTVISATHSRVRKRGHGWYPQNRARTSPMPSRGSRSSRRQLSTADQLDILRLGFIPPSSEHNDDHADAASRIGRGGSLNARRQLSTQDQLDILRLGFIPHSRSQDDESSESNDMIRFSRGGNVEIDTKTHNSVSPLAFASIMAFLAGFSDVICIRKFDCFAAMMSGNIVKLSMGLAARDWKYVMWKLSLILSYFLGSVSVRSVELSCKIRNDSESTKSSLDARPHLKIVAPIVGAVFAISEKFVGTSSATTNSQSWYIALLAFGYGMAYSSANHALNGTMTNLLTGHVTKIGSAVSDRFVGIERQWNKGISTSLCILGSFIIGGAFAGLDVVPKEYPIFAIVGITYALTLAIF